MSGRIITATIITLTALFGCDNSNARPLRSFATRNGYTVELLIDVNGAKVYRFYDPGTGRTVYFTDARGVVEWDEMRGIPGKGGHTVHIEVPTTGDDPTPGAARTDGGGR